MLAVPADIWKSSMYYIIHIVIDWICKLCYIKEDPVTCNKTLEVGLYILQFQCLL